MRHEIALRENTSAGAQLVFPTEVAREAPETDPVGKAVVLAFDGAVANVYATLVVRLARSELLAANEMWRNAVAFQARVDGTCGIELREVREGRGELALFFDPAASEETRTNFEAYVTAHLDKRAVQESIDRRIILVCPTCSTPVSDAQVQARKQRASTGSTARSVASASSSRTRRTASHHVTR